MRGTSMDNPTDWLEFDSVAGDASWKVQINFLMSNWNCIFGRGCEGHFGKDSPNTVPDIGCCTIGAWLKTEEERDRLQERVDRMTEEDVGPRGLAYIKKHGWLIEYPSKNEYNAKTRVREGGCVFAKRADDGNEKIGCAFLHLLARENEQSEEHTSHVESMPHVCWQVPLKVTTDEGDDGFEETTIEAWDADMWGGQDEDGTHDSWMQWSCVDTPDAYTAGRPLYMTMEEELRKIMGDEDYELLRSLLDERRYNNFSPMAGSVRNDGRKMLPLIVNGRQPARQPR